MSQVESNVETQVEGWVEGQTENSPVPCPQVQSLGDGRDAMAAARAELAQRIGKASPQFRGLIGVGLVLKSTDNLIDHQGRALVRNEDLGWHALIDAGSGSGRASLFTELLPTIAHAEALVLVPTGPVYDLLAGDRETSSSGPIPLPRDEWRLSRLAAQMDWAMSLTAARAKRQGWEKIRGELEVMDFPSPGARDAVVQRPAPEAWCPTPYVRSRLGAEKATAGFTRFPMKLKARFMDEFRAGHLVRTPVAGTLQVLEKPDSNVLQLKVGGWSGKLFLHDNTQLLHESGTPVKAGEALGSDWPKVEEAWHRQTMLERWAQFASAMPGFFTRFFQVWWDRQRVGEWLPFALASMENVSERKKLAWELHTPLTGFFDEQLEAYVPPPIFPPNLRFHGEVPGVGVTYDLRALLSH